MYKVVIIGGGWPDAELIQQEDRLKNEHLKYISLHPFTKVD